MIDLGISKIAVIGVVALIVIGPEKLPRVARMAGTLFGRAQRYISQVKSEVSREIELEELRRMQKEVQEAAHEVENSIAGGISQVTQEVQNAWHDSGEYRQPASAEDISRKAKDFRRKKLAKISAVPGWYKNQNAGRSHVISGAARVARHRPNRSKPKSFF